MVLCLLAKYFLISGYKSEEGKYTQLCNNVKVISNYIGMYYGITCCKCSILLFLKLLFEMFVVYLIINCYVGNSVTTRTSEKTSRSFYVFCTKTSRLRRRLAVFSSHLLCMVEYVFKICV